jgi:hypothetical protein
MRQIIEQLLALAPEQLWLIGGIVAELILQVVKRYLWQPPDWAKAHKLLAAALVSLVLAVGANAAGLGGLAATWLGFFASAIAYHEATDKTGLKSAWQQLLGRAP